MCLKSFIVIASANRGLISSLRGDLLELPKQFKKTYRLNEATKSPKYPLKSFCYFWLLPKVESPISSLQGDLLESPKQSIYFFWIATTCLKVSLAMTEYDDFSDSANRICNNDSKHIVSQKSHTCIESLIATLPPI